MEITWDSIKPIIRKYCRNCSVKVTGSALASEYTLSVNGDNKFELRYSYPSQNERSWTTQTIGDQKLILNLIKMGDILSVMRHELQNKRSQLYSELELLDEIYKENKVTEV